MSEPPNAFDLLKSSGKKRAHSSQGGGKESDHPRKKQEEAHVSGCVPHLMVLKCTSGWSHIT